METVSALEAAGRLAALLLLPPLLPGIVGKTKAALGGRKGPPLLQPYYDLIKLSGKGAVYSRTTTGIFRLGPAMALAAALVAGLVTPLARRAPLSFSGDAILFVYLLGLGRFATVAAALDAGSSFEGMGASREVSFSSLAEPALILALAALARATGSLSLSGMFAGSLWSSFGAGLILAAGSLVIVLLAENARLPVDDPATHLELTMIHEAMVLDHGGPDLALIQYGAAVKLFLLSSLLVGLLAPTNAQSAWAAWGAGMAATAMGIGAIEASMARLRLTHVPQLLVASICAAAFALVLALR